MRRLLTALPFLLLALALSVVSWIAWHTVGAVRDSQRVPDAVEETTTTVTPTTTTAATTTTSEATTTTTTSTAPVPGMVWARVPHDEAVFGGSGPQMIYSVTAGGPGLVAAGKEGLSDDSDPVVWVSADGLTWTRIQDEAAFGQPGFQRIVSVTAGGPGLIATGSDHSGGGSEDGALWVSADGYTWARIPDEETVFGGPGQRGIEQAEVGGPGFVAVGYETSDDGDIDGVVWVSADGYTWSRIDDEAVFGGSGDQWVGGVVVGGPGLVAVGTDKSAGTFDVAVWVSSDGLTWTRIEDAAVFGGPGDQQIWSVVVGGPGLVAAGFDNCCGSRDAAVWVSSDGLTWTRIQDEAVFGGPGDQQINSLAAGGPGIVAVGWGVSAGYRDGAVWLSADGYTWTRIDDEAVFGGFEDQEIRSVVVGGPGLVAVGTDLSGGDLDGAVWVSGPSHP